jgi:hypothetical protein
MISQLRSKGIEPQRIASDVNERSLAWALAVSGAIARRILDDRQCPHARPGARRPTTAMLMCCSDRRERFAARYGLGDDDGRCDVCDNAHRRI